MFCKICGSLLVPHKTIYGQWLSCSNGHAFPSEPEKETMTLTSKNTRQVQKMEVVSEENPLAVHNHKCKKCGYEKAELIEISCWYSDEDNIYRMKCGKCGCVEQMEGKVK